VRLVVSVRRPDELYYAGELPGPETSVVYTRESAPLSSRPAGRLREADLEGAILAGATAYVCGSSGFADHVTGLLERLGVPSGQIRVERFGPSG
jgi:ferredoxin-NADP reductase